MLSEWEYCTTVRIGSVVGVLDTHVLKPEFSKVLFVSQTPRQSDFNSACASAWMQMYFFFLREKKETIKANSNYLNTSGLRW